MEKKPVPPSPTAKELEAASLDLFGRPLAPTVRRIADASAQIQQDAPDRADFLHAVLCQVGMPRRATDERRFERRTGNVSMVLEAGSIWHKGEWKEQPLPYGTRPRLAMVHISTEAIRRQTRLIEVGDSMREFLKILGIDTSGGAKGGYTMFKKQMAALAACRMTIGMTAHGRDVTVNTQPITRFEAWLQREGRQGVLWPGVLEISPEFYATLQQHAVPLDYRALAALQHSALALDVYTWLAHRLCRVTQPGGVKLSWANLRDQFGQEYGNPKDFKKEFRQALLQARAVYADARMEETHGGITLKPSPPPIRKTQILVGEK